MNLLRVLLRSVCGSHPSDVPPKSKISVQIEQNGNGRRSGAFLHISFKNSSICKAFGVRQRPPQGAEFVCVPCGANNSKSSGSNTVRVRPPPPAPNQYNPNQIFLIGDGFGLFVFFEKFEDTHFRNGVVKRPESKPRGPRKPKLVKDKENEHEKHQEL